MFDYAIVEVDDGFTIIQFNEGESARDAALREGGVLVDENTYFSYVEAYEALEQLEVFDTEEDIA